MNRPVFSRQYPRMSKAMEQAGMGLTLSFLRQKRDQTRRLARVAPVDLGMPGIAQRPGENERMYCLQAVIATESVLRELAGSITEACIVPLGQHLWLLPVPGALFDAVTAAEAPELDGFWKAPADFDRLLTACSETGPVAYVVADYFGGAGTQTAQVWDAGKMVLGPLRLDEGQPSPTSGTPISQALRRLGAAKGKHVDEFSAVGLGRHRDTDDWLSPRNRSRPDERAT